MRELTFKKSLMIGFSLFLFLCFIGMLTRSIWSAYSFNDIRHVEEYVENPWVLKKEGNVLNESLQLPEFMEMERGKTYSISTTITYDGSQDESPYMFFHIDHAYARVILDGEVLFSYMPEDIQRWDRSHSPGFIYKEISMPKNCKGKTLEVEILPLLNTNIEYGLPDIKFGDFTPMLQKTFNSDIPHNIVIVLCMLLGICAILFSTATLNGSDYLEGITIGIFSLLFALYLLTETKLNVYYIGNPYYIYLLNYITFSLLPISMLGFMKERMLARERHICRWLIRIELVLFVIEMFLHFFGILDMREVIAVIHLIYFLEIFAFIFFLSFMKDKKKRRTLVIQLMPIIFGMILDGTIYWLHLGIGKNDATFTIFGVIIFLIVELMHVASSSVSVYTESIRSKLYRQMAYVDEMTNTGNRRSYEKEIDKIVSREKRYKTLTVVSLDVNNLKFVNDHYGHAAGDLLISNVSQIIMDVVGDHGSVFRTGGDEFFIFLYDTSPEEFQTMVHKTEEKIQFFNETNGFRMSIAIGMVTITDNLILEAVKEADRKMYINKANMKAETL